MSVLLAFEEDVIDVSVSYDKFPKSKSILALIDPVSFYEEEFEEANEGLDLNPKDWHVAGIGFDSPGTYFVMDLTKVFINLKTGEILPFVDYDIYSGGPAFSPVRAEDCSLIKTLNNEEHLYLERKFK